MTLTQARQKDTRTSPTGKRGRAARPGTDAPLLAPKGRGVNVPLLVLALLLIVGCAVTGGWLFSVAGNRSMVLVAARDIPPGHQLSEADLAEGQLSGSGVSAIAASERAKVVGTYAVAAVPAGTLLAGKMFAATTLPGPGQVAVGVALKPGQVPAELSAGRAVDVLLVPAAGAGGAAPGTASVLAANGSVLSITSSTSGGWIATVVVPEASATAVSAASSAGRVALVMRPLAVG